MRVHNQALYKQEHRQEKILTNCSTVTFKQRDRYDGSLFAKMNHFKLKVKEELFPSHHI